MENNFYKALGVAMKKQRKGHKLSQEELAMFMGVSRNCIANYETEEDLLAWIFYGN